MSRANLWKIGRDASEIALTNARSPSTSRPPLRSGRGCSADRFTPAAAEMLSRPPQERAGYETAITLPAPVPGIVRLAPSTAARTPVDAGKAPGLARSPSQNPIPLPQPTPAPTSQSAPSEPQQPRPPDEAPALGRCRQHPENPPERIRDMKRPAPRVPRRVEDCRAARRPIVNRRRRRDVRPSTRNGGPVACS